MTNKVYLPFNSGYTAYYVIRNKSGEVWYPAGATMETWGAGSRTVADYYNALTDMSGGMYVGDIDSNLPAGSYILQFYTQAGSAPSISADTYLSSQAWAWTGSTLTVSDSDTGTCGWLIEEIQALTGRTDDTILITAARCVRWLNEAQLDIVRKCKGHLDLETKDVDAITLVADTFSYSIASFDPVLFYLLRVYYMDGANSIRLEYKDTDEFDSKYPSPADLADGIPSKYTRRANAIEVYPVPTSSEAGDYLRVDYTKRPTAFSVSSLTATCDMNDAYEGLIYFGASKAFKAIGGDKVTESDRYWGYYQNWLDGYQMEKDGLYLSDAITLLDR